ncbi:MarR family winged helix-turn-helix transcriptional regulator [Cellulomonas sp. URHE0023]|uniref:MarR family winged helix-turn-helix transcriptional regulator n=1 Tax=Cellulomonas sp. URHE0023 TaxID=1380354 RepID=UPI000480F025|nr:MarR family winged helix-turn-helix transcriptional regulator [Cellulomonas sp. URHE0023]
MAVDLGSVLIDLVRVETRLYNGVDARLKDAGGLTLPQLEVLSLIRDVPGCRVLDISRTISITVGAASKAVDRLEEQGWCRRTVDPTDRRSSVLSLTADGATAVDGATPVFEAATRDTLGGLLPEPDLERLAHLLRTLRAALQPTTD